MKTCNTCGEEKPLIPEFWDKEKRNKDGFQNGCKSCRRKYVNDWKKNNREKVNRSRRTYAKRMMKTYYKKYPGKYRALRARIKADRKQRVPKWADLKAIEKIYENCPEGMDVDHDIPLKGTNVSGLHVENNLQYLTPEENNAKSNKFNDW